MPKSTPSSGVITKCEIILRVRARWYLTYPLSYRQVAEIVLERGKDIHHTTIFRWVQQYAPELDKRCRPHLCLTNDSWRVDETYIKIKGKDRYLYREERFNWSNSRLFVDGYGEILKLPSGFFRRL